MFLNNARDIFRSYIKEKGLRNTRQREEILDAFFSAEKHITVDNLFAALRTETPISATQRSTGI